MKNLIQERIALGIDIGGTKVSLGLMTERGILLKKYRYPMCPMLIDDFVSDLLNRIDVFIEQNDKTKQIAGIGIGVKGMVDFDNQMLIRSSVIYTDSTYDICKKLHDKYNLPVVIDNDVNASSIAEARFGAGRSNKYFTYVNIGTGTAVGIVDCGRLVRGKNNFSGELGCFLSESFDRHPSIYSLETVVSGEGFDRELRRLVKEYPQSILFNKIHNNKEKILSSEIFDAYRKDDLLAKTVVNNSLHILAIAIINLEFLLNSKLFVFGGGVADIWFIEQLNLVANNLSRQINIKWMAEFQISELGSSDVGLIGAASIFFESQS